MTITPGSLAAVVGVGVENQQFAVSAEVIPQKNLIIGTFDATTYSTLPLNVPLRIYSAEDVGAKTGFGFMLHRLAKKMFIPGTVETWVIPQAEAVGAAAATGDLDFSSSTGVVAGTIALYIANIRYAINTTAAMTFQAIGAAVAAAINADKECPVTAVNTSGSVALTSKSKGTFGNFISLAFNLQAGDATPSGVVCSITSMTGGTGIPDISAALNALGIGDSQNAQYFTNICHGYGWDITTLNTLSAYNGIGATGDAGLVGNYAKTVARPFRSLVGDIATGSAGLTAVLLLASGRLTDRTSGVIAVPGSHDHPSEIAAQALGVMAVTNSTRAEEGYIDKPLDGVSAGSIANDWTPTYTNRDQAVQGGVGTSLVKNGVVTLQNVITFYRPAEVNPADNGYRPMRNISIIQNLLYNYKLNFEGEKWKGISIVEDVTKVSNMTDRVKARDTDAVLDDLIALADVFAENAWLYSSKYTKDMLATGNYVQLRSGLTGWDIIFPVIVSGEGGILNSTITFDTSIAVLM